MKKVFNTDKSITRYYLDINRALKNDKYIKFRNRRYKFLEVVETNEKISILYRAKYKNTCFDILYEDCIEVLYIKNSEGNKLRYIITGNLDEDKKTCNDGYGEIICWERTDGTYMVR